MRAHGFPLLALRQKEITVDLIDAVTGPRVRRLQAVAVGLASALVFGLLSFQLGVFAQRALQNGETTAELQLPLTYLWWFMCAMAAATAMGALYVAARVTNENTNARRQTMRRCDIQLLASARQGDPQARCEAGRRYLLGSEGFMRSIPTALDYLTHPTIKDHPQAVKTIAEGLSLDELVEFGHFHSLRQAAKHDSVAAKFKLGVWASTSPDGQADAKAWFAAAAGSMVMAAKALAFVGSGRSNWTAAVLCGLSKEGAIDGAAIAVLGAREALQARNLDRLCACLDSALELLCVPSDAVSELVVAAVRLALETGEEIPYLSVETIQICLERHASAGDLPTMYLMGRALAGRTCDFVIGERLVKAPNLRAAAALLLRAAHGGETRAWLDLYRLHCDHRSSVANAQMSRFFLEKAAECGDPDAQRILGGLLLSRATSLEESERAIHWLFQAHSQGDCRATELLQTLVLPVDDGDAEMAQMSTKAIRMDDPFLASRLMLARYFGLTKLEAMTVDPVNGLRPWGLVVDRNPFIVHGRLSAPRAIPAVTDEARRAAIAAAGLFVRAGVLSEGSWRQRSLRLRRAIERYGIAESVFFASASATRLESLRRGPRWAFRARDVLQMALAA